MNKLLNEHYISAKGLDNALKVAKTLLEQDYQVMVQYEDCDIYIVSFAENCADEDGFDRFALITAEEEEKIWEDRQAALDAAAKARVEEMKQFEDTGDCGDTDDDAEDEDEDWYWNHGCDEDDEDCGRDEE